VYVKCRDENQTVTSQIYNEHTLKKKNKQCITHYLYLNFEIIHLILTSEFFFLDFLQKEFMQQYANFFLSFLI